MNPRRYPRTMNEAFGPAADNRLHPMPSRESLSERIADVALAVLIGISLAVSFVYWWTT